MEFKELIFNETPCPLCELNNDKIVLRGCDLLHSLPGEFTVVKCRKCGLIRTNPRPSPESIGYYYPDDYGPYIGTQVNEADELVESSVIKKMLKYIYHQWLNNYSMAVPHLAPGNLLEVGCASGSYLHEMYKKGWNVQGIEFSSNAAQSAIKLGYDVHIGSLETTPTPKMKFNLIVGWMVLEHLHRPLVCLKKLRECVHEDGYLVLSIPNCESLDFRLFKKNGYALHLPNHLYHYTPKTIAKTLAACGWQLEKVLHQRTLANYIGSLGFVLKNKGFHRLGQWLVDFPEKSGRWPVLLYPLAWLFGVFGQTGRMTLWVRPQ